ncbi:MAG: hypothetical protein QW728_05005, partial [Thermoplasmata archaeon]
MSFKDSKDSRARIGFSYVAIIVLLCSVALSAYVNVLTSRITAMYSSGSGEERVHTINTASLNIENQAYYIAMEAVRKNLNDLSRINPQSQAAFARYIEEKVNNTRLGDYLVRAKVVEYQIVFLPKLYYDIVPAVSLSSPDTDISGLFPAGFPLPHPAAVGGIDYTTTYIETNTTSPYGGGVVESAVYFRVVGKVDLCLVHPDRESTSNTTIVFDKNLYLPVPFYRTKAENLQSQAIGYFGEVSRLVRFILYTTAQYRVFLGYGSGTYRAGPWSTKT